MNTSIPFTIIPWENITPQEYPGITGTASWYVYSVPGLRIRKVVYSPGYLADHWCSKGHIVHCLSGSFINELATGEKTTMLPGMTYVVSDEKSSHRSYTETGTEILIIDGDFLASNAG